MWTEISELLDFSAGQAAPPIPAPTARIWELCPMAGHLLGILECVSSSCPTPKPLRVALFGEPGWWWVRQLACSLSLEGPGRVTRCHCWESSVSFLYTLSACVTVTRGEGSDVRLWQAKTLYGLSVHCYLSSLSIVPPRESDFVPQVVDKCCITGLRSYSHGGTQEDGREQRITVFFCSLSSLTGWCGQNRGILWKSSLGQKHKKMQILAPILPFPACQTFLQVPWAPWMAAGPFEA